MNIGLSKPSHEYYGNEFEALNGAEKDAIAMRQIAGECGFALRPLLIGKNATWAKVTSEIEAAAVDLKAGDIFLISFAGHGSEISPRWLRRLGALPRSVEPGETVQTWVLFDKELLDKELRTMWVGFNPDVRILIVLDSCHSFSAWKSMLAREVVGLLDQGISRATRRLLPERIQRDVFDRDKEYYSRKLNEALPAGLAREKTRAKVLALTACQDDQLAEDGDAHGLFTEVLLATWGASDRHTYRTFLSTIRDEVLRRNPDQTPGLALYPDPDSESFESEPPFAILAR